MNQTIFGPGDRQRRPGDRMPLPRPLREEVDKSIFPEHDVPREVPNQPGYPDEHREAWDDARRDYGEDQN